MIQIVKEMQFEIKFHILPFWIKLKDNDYGGYYGRVDPKHQIVKNSPKGSIINSRILWAFSASYNTFKDNSLLQYADHAFLFMKEKLIDTVNGGLYLFVDHKGKPLDKRKHINALSYAIYALSEYFVATKKNEVKNLAIAFFNIIESKKNQKGEYLEEFDERWVKKDNEYLDRFGLHAEFTLNNHVHILEGYTKLFNIWPEKNLLNLIQNELITFQEKIFNKKTFLLNEFFNSNWQSLVDLSYYGHDIECSWLLSHTLESTEIKNSKIIEIIEKICTKVKEEAFDKSSIILEKVNGKYNNLRMWWVQTEAVIGFVNMYQLTSDESYLKGAEEIWSFIKYHLIDSNPSGEWFAGVSENLTLLEEENIVDSWKGPYHNTRMCLEIFRRLQDIKSFNYKMV